MLKNKYRRNVGIVLVNDQGRIWVGDTILSKTSTLHQTYHYQMPQGGIEAGESPLDAVFRELYEETGLSPKDVKVMKESAHWYRYDFPAWLLELKPQRYKGQRQKWFLLRFTGQESAFKLDVENPHEFSDYAWFKAQKVVESIIPFKTKIYKKVLKEFGLL